jgi:serine O-acetyltransferase
MLGDGKMLREDYKAYNLNIVKVILSILTLNPFCLVAVFRFYSWLYKKHLIVLANMIRAVSIILFSADISPGAQIGGGLRIAHSVGIVIGDDAVIGMNAHIFQNVTIGSSSKTKNGRAMPVIGDNVSIFAGAVVIGAIQIGDNVSIGANAVVTKDFPSNVVVAGVPARIIGSVEVANSLRCMNH